MTVKLALGIPTINRADLLNDALKVYKDNWVGRDVYIVDNGNQRIVTTQSNQTIIKTPRNLGVSGSWNLLCDLLFSKGYTHIAILNDDIVWDKNVLDIEEFIDKNPSDLYLGFNAWSIFILPLTTWNLVGRFDEMFYPAYYEDNDYEYRIGLSGLNKIRSELLNPIRVINGSSSEKNPNLNWSNFILELYIKKWGGLTNQETFKTPYNSLANDYTNEIPNNSRILSIITHDERQVEIKTEVKKEIKRVGGVFNDGIKPPIQIFEKKITRSNNYDDNTFIEQPPFNYIGKTYNSVIPLKIFQTWSSSELPPKMKECVDELKRLNPEFEYHFFNDTDRENFIKENFDFDVLYAYRKLIPGAYRADLFRYCVLYIHGGIYLDIKFKPFKGFKFIELTEKEHFCWDLPESNYGISNGLMVAKPGNTYLLNAIKKVVYNVKNNFYGNSCLAVTGPLLLKDIFISYKNVDLKYTYRNGSCYVDKYNNVILTIYPEYVSERLQYYNNINSSYYAKLWEIRKIYHW